MSCNFFLRVASTFNEFAVNKKTPTLLNYCVFCASWTTRGSWDQELLTFSKPTFEAIDRGVNFKIELFGADRKKHESVI